MVKVRVAEPKDIKGISQVHVNSWRETYAGIVSENYLASLSIEKRIPVWTKIVSDREIITFVAELDGEIVGFVSGGPPQEPHHGVQSELAAIYLMKKAQKLEIGKKLFQTFIAEIKARGFKDMYLWVLRENPTANFYKKMGGLFRTSTDIEIGGAKLPEDMYYWSFQ